jgi:hypothetical protein
MVLRVLGWCWVDQVKVTLVILMCFHPKCMRLETLTEPAVLNMDWCGWDS